MESAYRERRFIIGFTGLALTPGKDTSMKIVLIKYPQSALEVMKAGDVMPADSDIGLTALGELTAQHVADALVSHFRGTHHIWSSTARRCSEPAGIISTALGVASRADDRL